MHVNFLGLRISIYPARKAQLALLLIEKVTVPIKYLNFADVFLEKLANIFSEQTRANEHTIKLKEGMQPPYGPIYSLGLVELEIFKPYIKTNLINSFIQASKSSAYTLILFVRKPNSSLCLCVNYQGLNNLTIKNRYLLPLIAKSLDQLGWAKQFTQFDLTSVYHWIRIKEGNEWKTVFQTWYGHFEYQVMPFGLSNAPSSFQSYINKILIEKLDIFIIFYLNDIFIYTKDPSQAHVNIIWWILEKLRKNSFFANLKNCYFYKTKFAFYGTSCQPKESK